MPLASFGLAPADLCTQVQNTLIALGVLPRAGKRIDVIGEIIERRYGVTSSGHFQRLLGAEYAHAIGLLVQAEATFEASASSWLSHQNSFNQVLYVSLQGHLSASGDRAAVTIVDRNGRMMNFGSTLDPRNAFSRNHPAIAAAFRRANDRRNKLPGSHPYDERTRSQTRHLNRRERDSLVTALAKAYSDLLPLCP